MITQEQIEGKWGEIKGGIRNVWGNITDEELDEIKYNILSVPAIVVKKYSETNKSILKKLNRLMETFENETDKSLKLNDGESSFQRSPIDNNALFS